MARLTQHRKKNPKGLRAAKKREAKIAHLLKDTQARSAVFSRYLDMIPVGFYLGKDHQQVLEADPEHDPRLAKSTSQIVAEAAKVEFQETRIRIRFNAKAKKKAERSGKPLPACDAAPALDFGTTTRAELQERLRQRIAQLSEERKQKQSEKDKLGAAKQSEMAKARHRERLKAQEAAANATEGNTESLARAEMEEEGDEEEEEMKSARVKAAKAAPKAEPETMAAEGVASPAPTPTVVKDQTEIGRLSFDLKASELPYGAKVGRRGDRVRRLQQEMRKIESQAERVRKAGDEGTEEDVKIEIGLQKAMMRARGESVHDDPSKLRKSQARLATKRKKTKEMWESRKEDMRAHEATKTDKRKEMSTGVRTKGQKKAAERNTFIKETNAKIKSDLQ